jgi:surfeit locus 1 family protein
MIKHLNKLSVTIPIPFTKRCLRFNVLLVLIFIVMEYGLFRLGFWQLDRAEQKRQLQQNYQQLQQNQPVNLSKTNLNVDDYQPVIFQGEPISELQVYLANEPYKGRDGYHILSAVKLPGGKIVWVNRGWVAALADRRQLPEISELPERWAGNGYAYFSKGDPILFDHALLEVEENQWLIQGLDYDLLSSVLKTRKSSALPFIIRLSKESDHGFIREWTLISMPPDKHLAYAVQWFGLAATLFIILLLLTVKRKDTEYGL